jgi:hypothetical protein
MLADFLGLLLRFWRPGRRMPQMKSRHHIRWVMAALVFGAAILPFLVYATGVRTLGPYSGGGPGAFYRAFAADLAQLRPAALALLLGPAVLVTVWRLLVAYAWRDDRRTADTAEAGHG